LAVELQSSGLHSAMKVSTKLYVAIGSLAATGLLVAISGSINLGIVGNELNESILVTAPKMDMVDSIRARGWEMLATMRAVYVFSVLNDQAKAEKSAQEWQAADKRMHELFGELRPLLVTDQVKALLAKIEGATAEYEPDLPPSTVFYKLLKRQSQEPPY